MKKIILTTALFVLITNLSIAETRTVELGEFTSIHIGRTAHVQLIQADRNEIIVPENVSDDAFRLRNNTLTIRGVHRIGVVSEEQEQVIVLFRTLERLDISGAARVSSDGEITGDELRLDLSGTGIVTLTLAYERILTTMSGTSQLNLSGTAQTHRIRGSGVTAINAREFRTQEANIVLSGMSRAEINTETVVGQLSGMSSLHLNPEAQHAVSTSGTAFVRGGEETEVTLAQNGTYVSTEITTERTSTRTRTRRFNPRYSGFDFGFGGFGQDFFRTTLPEGYENMELRLHQSFVINANLFDRGWRFGQSNFSIGTGLGFGWNIYRFQEHDMIPSMDRENRQFVINPYAGEEDRVYRKSNLRSSWLRIPVFLQYGDRDFAILAGVVGNVRLGASAKQVYTFPDSNRRQRFVSRDDFYLQGFRLDTEVRITFRSFGIFASYSLTEMFLNNRGPELNAFSFGATLVF